MDFRDFLVQEGTDEAKVIRTALKNKLKLTNRDVSVKARSGGYSSAVNVTIKNMKALQLISKIEEIGSSQESYERDERTGTILSGGNTFIFTEIDWKFRQSLSEQIQKEFEKVIKKKPLEDGRSIKIYGFFEIVKPTNGGYFARIPKQNIHTEIRDIKYVGEAILGLIKKSKDDTLYSKIK